MDRRTLFGLSSAAAVVSVAGIAEAKPPAVSLFNVRQLCMPTLEAINLIDVCPIVEIGSGDGYWVRALLGSRADCIGGYDISPRGPNVIYGDHKDAAKAAAKQDAALLAVWPPDGPEVQRWIAAREWPIVTLVGNSRRYDTGTTLAAYKLVKTIEMPAGIKGGNRLNMYARS